MIQGIALVIDEEFRRREHCALCEQVLGEPDFVILIQDHIPPSLACKVEFQHVGCRIAFAELMDETRL